MSAVWNLGREQNMWTCPKCGRKFKRTNQGHYCGKAPETVLEYINSQPIETRSHLTEMMLILQKSVPCVNERILWSMPYYEKEGKKENLFPFLLVKSTSAFM